MAGLRVSFQRPSNTIELLDGLMVGIVVHFNLRLH